MVPRAWGHEIESGLAEVYYALKGSWRQPKQLVPFICSAGSGVFKNLICLMRLRPTVIVANRCICGSSHFVCRIFFENRHAQAKIFVHEQNAVLGRLNKLAARFADQVGVAFPETKVPEHKKAYVGYPVRAIRSGG